MKHNRDLCSGKRSLEQGWANSGPRKRSGKTFKSEISFSLSHRMLVLRRTCLFPWEDTPRR